MNERQLAFVWHCMEFLVAILLALSIVGLGWSIRYLRKPHFWETKRPA